MGAQEIQAVLLLLLITLHPPLEENSDPLQGDLFSNCRGSTFPSRDVFLPTSGQACPVIVELFPDTWLIF